MMHGKRIFRQDVGLYLVDGLKKLADLIMGIDSISDGLPFVSDYTADDFVIDACNSQKSNAGVTCVMRPVRKEVQIFYQRLPIICIVVGIGQMVPVRGGKQIFAIVLCHPVV